MKNTCEYHRFSSEDISRMIKACQSSHDRAMIQVFYEGALRPSELSLLKWKHISFDKNGVVFIIMGMKDRSVRLVDAKQYLEEWMKDYPLANNEDASVFLSDDYRPLSYRTICQKVREIANKVGVEKEFPLSSFRFSRIQDMIQKGIINLKYCSVSMDNQLSSMRSRGHSCNK